MSKIGIVGDVHLVERNHRCRRDNFLETALSKLKYIAENNDYVIILGDLFHLNSNSNYLFNVVYKFLSKYPNKFYCIPGNHDIFHGNLNSLDRTTIGALYFTGALRLEYENFKIEDIEFAVSLTNGIDKVEKDESNDKILLGHNYYDSTLQPDETFTKDKIRELNYKYVFLGHDHKPYEEEFIGNSTVIRMGSLTRIDTQEYNKDREVCYYQYDTVEDYYKQVYVPMKKSEEVYIKDSFSKEYHIKKYLTLAEIGKAIKTFTESSKGTVSLDKTLEENGVSEMDREQIKSVHRLCMEIYT